MSVRSFGAAALALALVVGLAGVALALTETAADDFSSNGYDGSTGTVGWAGDWREVGESDGAGSGTVQVRAGATCAAGGCLTVERLLSLGLADAGASRPVDLSSATSARLSYYLEFPGGLVVGGTVTVEARPGSGGWITLRQHGPGDEGHFTADLPVGDTITVRFRAADLALDTKVSFDDVEVVVSLPDPTITTVSITTTTLVPSTTTTTTRDSGRGSSPATPTTGPTTTAPAGASPSATTPATDQLTTTTVPEGRNGVPNTEPPLDGPDVPIITVPDDAGDVADGPSGGDGPTPEGRSDELEATAVVRTLDPGLMSSQGWGLPAQRDLLVIFGLSVEDVTLDILGSAVLGAVLGWASLRRRERPNDGQSSSSMRASTRRR